MVVAVAARAGHQIVFQVGVDDDAGGVDDGKQGWRVVLFQTSRDAHGPGFIARCGLPCQDRGAGVGDGGARGRSGGVDAVHINQCCDVKCAQQRIHGR